MGYKCLLDSATKTVVNVILLDDGAEWVPSEGQELAPQHDGNIGDTWDGTKFVAPLPPLTEEITPLDNTGSQPNVIG